MEIVGAFACSHAGFLISAYDQASPELRQVVYDGFGRMRDFLQAAKPDALVVIATDHGRIYPLQHQPQYVIGVGAVARGIGDAGMPPCEVPINQSVAQAVLEGCIRRGVDLAYSESVSIDHSFVTPLMLATPGLDTPIVPVVQNTRMPPMPTLERSYEVGRILGEALRSGPPGRVAVLGTGGLSHWVGSDERRAFMKQPAGTRHGHEDEFPLVLPPRGHINAEWDHDFLSALDRGQAREFIANWPDERIAREAGNGALEIRNWITVAGVTQDAPIEVLGYAAVPEWHTGSAVAQFRLPN
jgi:2,3-dihydroxyphenylpropionate 1,2-dioxygenase